MASGLGTFINTFNSKIEEPVRIHLKNVYACLTLATISAALGAYIDLYTNILSRNFITVLGAIGFLVALNCTKDNGKNQLMRLGFLIGFSFCSGLGLGPLLEQVILIDPSIIPTTLLATSLIFVSFSLSALLARRGSWLFLGGTITTILSALFVFSLASMFLSSTLLFQAHLYVGLVLMCAFVLYDTQLIMEKRRHGDKDFIAHSVDLFIDFIGIFRRLLIILAQKENNKRDEKRR
ncbi:probable Bax inhibitor 1 isoform X1 [Halyomorpha halys]|uniref:probable Bax inhibitor 1 isoform X1 n=1 Tax=Halyomorpha halys TaxID=286706 RepID=UPI0006D4C72B|nr:probable Bax inhibitor 1 isoform X1 [Halyomorpha halys]